MTRTSRMLEAQPLDRVGQLDVDAEIVGVELELVALEQRALLVDVHQQRRDLAVDRELPVPVARRIGLEVDPRPAVASLRSASAILRSSGSDQRRCPDADASHCIKVGASRRQYALEFRSMQALPAGHRPRDDRAASRLANPDDHRQASPRRLAVRRVAHARQQRDLDRAVAFLLRDLDLPRRAVLIVLALHDQDRHADVGERVGDVPLAEIGIEPGVVPAAKGVVDVGVPARELVRADRWSRRPPWRARSRRCPCPR